MMASIDSSDDDSKDKAQPDSQPNRNIVNDKTQATEVSLVAPDVAVITVGHQVLK